MGSCYSSNESNVEGGGNKCTIRINIRLQEPGLSDFVHVYNNESFCGKDTIQLIVTTYEKNKFKQPIVSIHAPDICMNCSTSNRLDLHMTETKTQQQQQQQWVIELCIPEDCHLHVRLKDGIIDYQSQRSTLLHVTSQNVSCRSSQLPERISHLPNDQQYIWRARNDNDPETFLQCDKGWIFVPSVYKI